MPHCPLCFSKSSLFYNSESQSYFRCLECKGIFANPDKLLLPNKEQQHYQNHNNDPQDCNYQKFVSPIVDYVKQHFNQYHKGLDFGSGKGSAISKMLTDDLFQIVQYDPYFIDNRKVLENSYNFIACCEVLEHFYYPNKEFQLLKKLLYQQGAIVCMTELYHESIDFSTWYYKNDPTHVFFYSKETCEWIQRNCNFSKVEINGRLIVFEN